MTNTQREWEGQADLIQQYFFERGARVDRAAFDFVLAELTKARAEGAAAERERISSIIKSRLPDPMTPDEMDKYHCEGTLLYWGTHLLKALSPTKDKGEDVSSNN